MNESGGGDYKEKEELSQFDRLTNLLNGEEFTTGESKHGGITISKQPDGSINVLVMGLDLIDTHFNITEAGIITANAGKSTFTNIYIPTEEPIDLVPTMSLTEVVNAFVPYDDESSKL